MKRILIILILSAGIFLFLQQEGLLNTTVRPPGNAPQNLRFIFLHGGPGYDDYFKGLFGENFGPHGVFYTQSKGPKIQVKHLVGELNQKMVPNTKNILVGHSWGGVLALEALRYPAILSRVAGLVLISTPLHHKQEQEFQAQLAKVSIPSVANIYLSNSEQTDWQQFLATTMKTFDRDLANRFSKQYLGKLDHRGQLAHLRVPVLYIFGSEDIRVPAAGQRNYNKLRPKMKMIEIPKAGHFPFLMNNHRSQVAQAIWDFALPPQ